MKSDIGFWGVVLSMVVVACERDRGGASAAPSRAQPATEEAGGAPYLQRLEGFKTKLVRRGPAPQEFDADEKPPAGVSEISYVSDGLKLKAWFALPPKARATAKVPGLLYLHGGFAFGADDLEAARPFLLAGMAVLCPMLRGENGNPGASEMYLGEVRDGKSALQWLAQRSEVDAGHLYAFGHSAGGIIASLLSLHEAPLRHSGSAGALYGPKLFDWMAEQVPFALDDPEERSLRLLLGNTAWMKHPHYAYLGKADLNQSAQEARVQASASHDMLHVAFVPGNHLSSLAPAISEYLTVIANQP